MSSHAPDIIDPCAEVRSCLRAFTALSEARFVAVRDAQRAHDEAVAHAHSEHKHRGLAIEHAFWAEQTRIEANRNSIVDAADADLKRIDTVITSARERYTSGFGKPPPPEIEDNARTPTLSTKTPAEDVVVDHANQRAAVEELGAQLGAAIDELAAHPAMQTRRWVMAQPGWALLAIVIAIVVPTAAGWPIIGGVAAFITALSITLILVIVFLVWTERQPTVILGHHFASLYRAARSAAVACAAQKTTTAGATAQNVRALDLKRTAERAAIAKERDEILACLAPRLDSLLLDADKRWQDGVGVIANRLSDVERFVHSRCPDWEHVVHFVPSYPIALPIGTWTIALACPGRGDSGSPASRALTFPALLPFPNRPSVLVRYAGSGSGNGVAALQALMLRILVSLPPGKARFTVIDPIGLGRNFAQFMHLVDFDENLMSNRIWTESNQIEKQLEELTEHMTLVIQKYLRGEYDTITDYNRDAGEVAEPYHFLVIADFPARFSQTAGARLQSIASAGQSCGVYILASMDSTQELPGGFNLEDFQTAFTLLDWKDGAFHMADADFGALPLGPDRIPAIPLMREILQTIGSRAVEGSKVEVPFDFVVPRHSRHWRNDVFERLSIPIGRAGARRIQHLQLGAATAQHAVIAGKTGSGKSTLLHTIITSVALLYDPDSVELYLVDFKKGVEFKPYATHRLPHARVIAIESEREFGLSVLKQLDHELKRRGDLFRLRQCPDLASLARKFPAERCPRIVLLVDEFQEFFTDDDRLAREAALLLDRLVRQGRAFGIHVILGSQTLGGAYSLARPTLDQMAIRIALQCSDADARLVLGDDNAAARVLTRPGEAIYNDSNGAVEGNSLFQVAWLPEDERDRILMEVAERARLLKGSVVREPLVFEGNAPADVRKMPVFRTEFADLAATVPPSSWPVWIGQPTTISDATQVMFRRQDGSNLMIVGNHDHLVAGMLWSIVVSIASQHACRVGENRAGADIWFVNGSTGEPSAADVLPNWFEQLNIHVTNAQRNEAREVLATLATLVKERMAAEDGRMPRSAFLLLHGAHLVRDLRRSVDYKSRLSGRGEEQAMQYLLTILADGPSVEVHTIMTCDSLGGFGRVLDRSAIGHFDIRVLLQMSPTDSTALSDTPAAGKLGPYRALLYLDDRATVEKFTPYTLPNSIVAPPQCLVARQSVESVFLIHKVPAGSGDGGQLR